MSSDVYVVFTNDRSNWWSPFLKKGVRHCYVVIPSADRLIHYGKLTDEVELFTKEACLLYTSPSPRDRTRSRMPSSA